MKMMSTNCTVVKMRFNKNILIAYFAIIYSSIDRIHVIFSFKPTLSHSKVQLVFIVFLPVRCTKLHQVTVWEISKSAMVARDVATVVWIGLTTSSILQQLQNKPERK